MSKNNLDTINSYILKQVQDGKMTKDMAFQILKELNRKKEVNDIAVIGIACKFPGSKNIKEFWDNLINGINSISKFPLSRRKDIDPLLPPMENSEVDPYFIGGYLEEIDKFDPEFFNLSDREALLMDPMQRLFLETAYEAIEDAGLGGNNLYGTKSGVYVGKEHTYGTEYKNLIVESDPWVVTGTGTGFLSRRLSHILNLQGPSVVIDTSCSSGLVAIHSACQALKNEECELAIAGGVNLFYIPTNRGKATVGDSSDGIVRVFDKDANGIVWSEGVGAVLLKPLTKALADRDHIYSIIKGSAVNNDGATSFINSPNVDAREDIILKAWKNAGIDPKTLSYIEAHGSGTLLGDPVEIKALDSAFQKFTNQKHFCGIGSVKPNIGQPVAASGLASFLKAIMAMQHKLIPPTIHYEEPNPYINFDDSAMYVIETLTEWKTKNLPRRVGISAFGLSGTNCHLVMEEAPNTKKEAKETGFGSMVLTLSAKSKGALMRLVKNYADFIETASILDFADICYTANTGRGHYTHRVALQVDDMQDLQKKIALLLDQDLAIFVEDWFYYGEHKVIKSTKKGKEGNELTEGDKWEISKTATIKLKKLLDRDADLDCARVLNEICQLYIKGAEVQWAALFRGQNRSRVGLPTYPFERKRLWYVPKAIPNNLIFASKFGNDQMSLSEKKEELTLPTDFVEEKLVRIWSEILGIAKIGIHDNYFALGGASIKATRIVAEIYKEFSVELPQTILFNLPTIAEVAVAIREAAEITYQGIEPVEAREYYPVSAGQKRLYILNQLKGNNINYNIPQVMVLEGKIDSERLGNAFSALVKRHESFRTSFDFIAGEPVQRIHETVDFKMDYFKVEEAEVEAIIRKFIRHFDLRKPLLLRADLIQCPTHYVLIFDMHHIISDGSSIDIIMRDLINLYAGFGLPELTIQYKDFSAWQNKLFQSDVISEQEEYWVNQLKDIAYTVMPGRNTEEPDHWLVDQKQIIFEEKIKARLDDYCVQAKVTKFIFLLTIFKIILHKESNQNDLAIGTPIAGRNASGLEKVVGLFLNVLVIRSKIADKMTFKEYLEQVRTVVMEAQENQDYPYDQLYAKLKEEFGYQNDSLYSIVFNYLPISGRQDSSLTLTKELTIKPYKNNNIGALTDMTLYVEESTESLFFNVVYRSDLYKERIIERILEDMKNVSDIVLDNENILISEIELKEEDNMNQFVYNFDDDLDNAEFFN